MLGTVPGNCGEADVWLPPLCLLMTPGPEPAGCWRKSIFPFTGEEGALGGLPAEEETQDGGCGSQNIAKFSEAGPIRCVKRDTRLNLGT